MSGEGHRAPLPPLVLTSTERTLLKRLVREEARRLGYGDAYGESNYKSWPPTLKRVRKIWRALDAR